MMKHLLESFKNQDVRAAMFNVIVCLHIKIPQDLQAFILNDALRLTTVPLYSLSQVTSLAKLDPASVSSIFETI